MPSDNKDPYRRPELEPPEYEPMREQKVASNALMFFIIISVLVAIVISAALYWLFRG